MMVVWIPGLTARCYVHVKGLLCQSLVRCYVEKHQGNALLISILVMLFETDNLKRLVKLFPHLACYAIHALSSTRTFPEF